MIDTAWNRLVDATARWSLRGAPDRDADRLASRRSVIGISIRVAGVSAALVIGIIALVVAYVAWQLTPGQQREQPGPFDVHITLDTLDLTVAIIGVGGLAILFAGVASWLIARSAVRPLTEALHVQRTFVADASHELRTPLAVLHARVQRLRMQTPDDDPRRRIVDDLTSDTRILIDIVDDLLEAAAGTRSEPGVAGLQEGLARLRRDMSVLADDRHVRLHVVDHSASVGMTPTQLHRCLVALTDNAIGHTPPGGTVTVTTTPEHDRVCVRVQDDGSGISGIEPTRVFDRFAHGTGRGNGQGHGHGHGHSADGTRTGNGIGLALVREIVVRAGGDVTVESTGDHGTVFALRIPTAHSATSAPTITRRAEGR